MSYADIAMESGGDDVKLSVESEIIECSVKLNCPLDFLGPTPPRMHPDLGMATIKHDPAWQIRPTMRILAEIDAAEKVKYGKPKMSIHACRFYSLKASGQTVKPENTARQESLF